MSKDTHLHCLLGHIYIASVLGLDTLRVGANSGACFSAGVLGLADKWSKHGLGNKKDKWDSMELKLQLSLFTHQLTTDM